MEKWGLVIGLLLVLAGCSPKETVVKPEEGTPAITYKLMNEAGLSQEELDHVSDQVKEATIIISQLIETDYEPAKSIDIVLYKESGMSYGDVSQITLHMDNGVFPIFHELTHTLLGYGNVEEGKFIGNNGFFTQEGFAEYVESEYGSGTIPGYEISLHKMMRQTIALKRNLPLRKLTDNILSSTYFRSYVSSDEENALRFLSYIHAGSFVTYLIEEYGLHTFEGIYDTGNVKLAVKETYGKDIETLESEWLDYIKKNEKSFSDKEKMDMKGYADLEKSILQIDERYY
ncbi:hypothetical protein [Pseudalkalibacillus berkeleyi]|uniref:Uncharacterized protein n=1 Tax=Pseudalkalibacillus berkeleyi TaxID=1069813 RepID=A0ABS9GXE0_9BACL|nr:hypothetical protein [Pseudalkalibacillus berkeleyi]MCF6136486.1 hypothetical protein [Pseudalkalibacillus berkeleyi]